MTEPLAIAVLRSNLVRDGYKVRDALVSPGGTHVCFREDGNEPKDWEPCLVVVFVPNADQVERDLLDKWDGATDA